MKIVLIAALPVLEEVFALSKRRLKFSKMGMAKYISHLDLLRCFTRAIMRSGLPVEYSQGFNPHQKITFALPLPVGVTSECEFVDISFEENKTNDDEILSKLNLNLPPDIRILGVGDIIHKSAEIICAEYEIELYPNEKIADTAINNFFGHSEVVVMKKTKKKTEKPINIMEYLRAWEIMSNEDKKIRLRVILDAGGERNLKPDVLISKLCEELSAVRADDAVIHRKRVFCRQENADTSEEFC